MKLNEQCMIDILGYCIDNIHITSRGYVYSPCKLLELSKQFPQYEKKDILYSLVKLIEMNYITINTKDVLWNENTNVVDVTYYGHKYYEEWQR